jgi:hypothetical protein
MTAYQTEEGIAVKMTSLQTDHEGAREHTGSPEQGTVS